MARKKHLTLVQQRTFREKIVFRVDATTGRTTEILSRKTVQQGPTLTRPFEADESLEPTDLDLKERGERRSQIGDFKNLKRTHLDQ